MPNNKTKGISLIALILTIIVIVILAVIVIGVALETPNKAVSAKFINDLSEIKQAVAIKRAQNLTPKLDESVSDINEGFTKIQIKKVPEGTAEDGWVVDLNLINIKKSTLGNEYSEVVEGSEITFGSDAPDIYVYDTEGEVYYAQGLKGEWQTTYSMGDAINEDAIADVEAVNPAFWDFDPQTGTIYEYTGPATQELIIPNKIKGVKVVEIRGTRGEWGDCMLRNYGVESVIISPGIKIIGYNCFEWCDSVTNISIPNTVTRFDEYAFQGAGIEHLTIPNSVIEIKSSAFYYAEYLKDITLPESVKIIGETAFESCYVLENINVEEGNTAYKSIDGVLFSKDGTLLHTYPLGNTRDSYIIPDGVTDIGISAFAECENLTSITISDSVINIKDFAFDYGTFINLSIGKGLQSIGEDAFYSCRSLQDITVSSENTTYKSINGVLFDKTETALYLYPIGNTRTSYIVPNTVTTIKLYAFARCANLTSITIPNTVQIIEDGAFSRCTGLTNMTIPDSVTTLGDNVFSSCESLANISFGQGLNSIGDNILYYTPLLTAICVNNQNLYFKSVDDALLSQDGTIIYKYPSANARTIYNIPSGVIDICNYAFYSCGNFTQITLPDSVTDIGDFAFYSCGGATTITLGNGVRNIGRYAFNMCSNLTSMTLPNSVITLGDGAFCSCSKLASLTLSNSITSIGTWTFEGCGALTGIIIPSGVTSIGDYAFYQCTKLTSVSIPNTVTTIGLEAFRYCSKLPNITIPSSVTTIGTYAFRNCTLLTQIIINKNTNSIAGAKWGAPAATVVTWNP